MVETVIKAGHGNGVKSNSGDSRMAVIKAGEYGRVIYTLRTLILVDMTSTTDWSERTDDTEQQPPNSPSRMIAGDDHIAECSDLFREAIQARNVYAAWARKLTNARPNDPKLQSYHQEVTKAGESVELLLVKLNVPLFRIPASEKELDKIILRVKNRVSDPPAEKNEEEKKPAAVPPPPPHPVQRVERRNEASMLTASLPKQLVRKVRSPRSTPSLANPFFRAYFGQRYFGRTGRRGNGYQYRCTAKSGRGACRD
ncbi:hypothetical protein TNCV_3737641 [Trichonephila clavipes]|nr:hypothetical protein TNCV_3737641 [Trichonephila clavipes]